MVYTYPACFYPYAENGGGFLAVFPDLPGCTTGGKTLEEAIYMADDAACGWLFSSIESGEELPKASDIKGVIADEYPGGFVNIMRLDVDEFIRKTSPKSTHKNCTVPLWLSNIADKKGINFSYVLCEGLKKQLGLSS
jgi:predicted RNase H-like HicB family nuclease